MQTESQLSNTAAGLMAAQEIGSAGDETATDIVEALSKALETKESEQKSTAAAKKAAESTAAAKNAAKTTVAAKKAAKSTTAAEKATKSTTAAEKATKSTTAAEKAAKSTTAAEKAAKSTTAAKKATKSTAKKATARKKTKGQKAAKLAKSYKGVPYVYAGASPSGFDCSGLTSYVYGKLGVKLTHNAQAQYNECTKVSLDNLKTGDLVFFGSSAYGIRHVGMYVGSGKYIHAPRPGAYVRVDTLANRTDCVGACRPY